MIARLGHAPAMTLFIGLIALGAAGPLFLNLFHLLQLATFSSMALATLGLAFVWGSMGVLNFGHASFFGLGAYAYALTALNLGDTTPALLAAVVVPVLFAGLLGYFLFFGRVGDVYLAVITLCVSLILFNFMNSTSDPAYRIGEVPFGGFNGINAIPPLNWPGHPEAPLSPEAMFRLSMVALGLVYGLSYLLLLSGPGRAMTAIRENELRSELLGYDIRLYKIAGLAISAGVAGLGGALFAANAGYVGPTVFGLNQASQFLLWVIAGGLGTLSGPILASFALQYLATVLGTSQFANTSLVFGGVIILFVLVLPRGIVPAMNAAAATLSVRWKPAERRQQVRPERERGAET